LPLPEMPHSSYNLQLFADYHHFYLQDEDAEGDLSDSWDAQAIAAMLAVGPGVVGIGTARNTDVPVSIILLEAPPDGIDVTQ